MSDNDSYDIFDHLQEMERRQAIFLSRDSGPPYGQPWDRRPANAPGGTEDLPSIKSAPGDHPRFISVVRRVLEWCARCEAARSVRAVRIDNWFGPKWCRFAGKLLGSVGVAGGRLVIPPFVPARVDSETSWLKIGDTWSRDKTSPPLHRRISSAANLRRYFDLHCPATTALWFSSGSASNERGAIMVYSSAGFTGASAWYVALAAAKDWNPSVAAGIAREAFSALTTDVPVSHEQRRQN